MLHCWVKLLNICQKSEYGTSDDDNKELTFHYELDEDGYVKKVEVKNLDGSETWWTETYTYERVK